MHAPDRLRCTRIVSTPAALDAAVWPVGVPVCRIAADEVLLLDEGRHVDLPLDDPHAIRRVDTGWAGITTGEREAGAWLARTAEWEVPKHRPAFVQGVAMGLPVKIWWAPGEVRIFVAVPYAADFAERLR